jgi:hypothetical protein
MVRVRLRTKFLLSMVLVSAGLTSLSLLLVRHTIQGKVVDGIYSDLQTSTTGFTREMAQSSLSALLQRRERWWFGANHLYEVFVKPIYFGPAADNRLLGFLVVGYEIDSRVASQIGRIANSKVAFSYNGAVVITTLSADLNPQFASQDFSEESGKARALELGNERFLQTTVDLTPGAGCCSVWEFWRSSWVRFWCF